MCVFSRNSVDPVPLLVFHLPIKTLTLGVRLSRLHCTFVAHHSSTRMDDMFQSETAPPPSEDQAGDVMMAGGGIEGMMSDQPVTTTETPSMGGLDDDPYDQPNPTPVNGFMQPPEAEEKALDDDDSRLFASQPTSSAFGVQESGPYQVGVVSLLGFEV